MNSFIVALAAAIVLGTSAQIASAGNETDKALGAGSYLHPNGPANGVWNTQGRR
jgi:hypothetical protein